MPDLSSLLLSPRGRLGRQGFWISIVGLMLVGIVAGALPVIGGAVGLALLWPQTAVAAKRLHDIGRSGKLVLVPLVPAVAVGLLGLTVAMTPATLATSGMIFGLAALAASLGFVAMLIGLAFLLWIGLTPGEARANRWGEVPAPLAIPGLA